MKMNKVLDVFVVFLIRFLKGYFEDNPQEYEATQEIVTSKPMSVGGDGEYSTVEVVVYRTKRVNRLVNSIVTFLCDNNWKFHCYALDSSDFIKYMCNNVNSSWCGEVFYMFYIDEDMDLDGFLKGHASKLSKLPLTDVNLDTVSIKHSIVSQGGV